MPDRRTTLAWLAASATLPPQMLWAADVVHDSIPPFKAGGTGASVAAGWMHQLLPKVDRPNRFALVEDEGKAVLQVQSDKSASSYLALVSIDPAKTPFLHWRWKVSRALDGSDITAKAGDDFAARVYVLFDLPLDELSFGDRLKIRAARALTSGEIPTAALCYVWGKAQPVGFTGWNAYTDRLRMIVVDSGSSQAGKWRSATRNVAEDFRAAFNLAAPPVRGIAIGSDTDNTGESVETRFGDLSFSAQR
ncbi:MAG: DUF3047 domain-containing protein [Variovorax sp.]